MRIKSCNIKAFGNIKDKEIDFAEGINCFIQDNGEGKTTLADYIRVMLYGMKTWGTKDSTMGDRRRYLPYEGKKLYGGSMTVEVGGEDIVITRTFDEKTNTRDTLTINGIETSEKEQTIGEKYFNIDEDAFKRTVYISSLTSSSDAVRATDSINRNMDMMVTDINTVDLDNVLKSFDERCNAIQSGRAKKNRGEINRLDEEVDNISSKLSELRYIDENLEAKYSDLNQLEKEQNRLAEKLETVRKRTQELAIWRQIDDYQEKIATGNETLEQLKLRYPEGLPTEVDIKAISEANTAIGNADSALKAMQESAEADNTYTGLEKRYSIGYDTEEYERIKALKKASDAEKIRIESESKVRLQGEELTAKFSIGIPSEVELEDNKSKSLKYKGNKEVLQTLATMPVQAPIPVMWIIIGAIGVVAGIVLLALGMKETGIAISALSVAGVVLALVLSRSNGNNAAQSRALELNEENSRLESELKRFYAPFGFFDTAFTDYAESLRKMVSEYKAYLEAKEARDKDLEERRKKAEKAQREVETYMERYGVAELTSIESDYNTYTKQKEQRRVIQTKRSEYQQAIEEKKHSISEIFSRYGLQIPEDIVKSVEIFRADLANWNTITNTIADIEKTIEKLKKDNKLTTKPEDIAEGEDIDTLKGEYEKAVKLVGKLSEEISKDEENVKNIDSHEARLEEIGEEKRVLVEKLALLKKTKSFIESADKTLKDKFVGPIRDKYRDYMKVLLPKWAEDIEMDTDYRVKVKVDHIAHDCDHLSQGERTCLEMALRIAVIDNMYKEEKPFLVMDDPFVELDKENMAKAKELVRKISERYQVVYFCCHESRVV